jgi:hypothetical protein
MDEKYIQDIYNDFAKRYGAKNILPFQDFSKKITTDSAYARATYNDLSKQYGEKNILGFDDFYQKVKFQQAQQPQQPTPAPQPDNGGIPTVTIDEKTGQTKPTGETAPPSQFDVIGAALEASKLSKKMKALPSMSGGVGSIPSITQDEQAIAKSNSLRKEIEEAGYDYKKVENIYADLPFIPAKLKNVDEALDLAESNPQALGRLKANVKWAYPLAQKIGGEGINNIINKGLSQMTPEGRSSYHKEVIETINKNLSGKDAEEAIENFAKESEFQYGSIPDSKIQEWKQDPKYSKFNDHQIKYLKFLEDFRPQEVKTYRDIIEGYDPNLYGFNDEAKLGYESKAMELERRGMAMEANYAQEVMQKVEAQLQDPNFDKSQSAKLLEDYTKAKNTYDKVVANHGKLKDKYPSVAKNEAFMQAQELTEQNKGFWGTAFGVVKEEVKDVLTSADNLVQSAFIDDKTKVNRDIAEYGDKLESEAENYQVSKNKFIQPEQILSVDEDDAYGVGLKKWLEATKGLSTEERIASIADFLYKHPSAAKYVQNKNAGDVNITGGSIADNLSRVGSQLVSTVLLSATTGGLGNISKARQLATLFGTTLSTVYQDYKKEAIDKNISDPDKYALQHSVIDALSELGVNDLAIAKKVLGKSGKALEGLDEQSFRTIAGGVKGKARLLGEAVLKQTGKSAAISGGETFEETGANVGHTALNKIGYDEKVAIGEGNTETAVGTLIPMFILGFAGLPAQIAKLNRTQRVAFDTLKKDPSSAMQQLNQLLAEGKISPEDADKAKASIKNISSPKTDTNEKERQESEVLTPQPDAPTPTSQTSAATVVSAEAA